MDQKFRLYRLTFSKPKLFVFLVSHVIISSFFASSADFGTRIESGGVRSGNNVIQFFKEAGTNIKPKIKKFAKNVPSSNDLLSGLSKVKPKNYSKKIQLLDSITAMSAPASIGWTGWPAPAPPPPPTTTAAPPPRPPLWDYGWAPPPPPPPTTTAAPPLWDYGWAPPPPPPPTTTAAPPLWDYGWAPPPPPPPPTTAAPPHWDYGWAPPPPPTTTPAPAWIDYGWGPTPAPAPLWDYGWAPPPPPPTTAAPFWNYGWAPPPPPTTAAPPSWSNGWSPPPPPPPVTPKPTKVGRLVFCPDAKRRSSRFWLPNWPKQQKCSKLMVSLPFRFAYGG